MSARAEKTRQPVRFLTRGMISLATISIWSKRY